MSDPRSPSAIKFGVTYTPADVQPRQSFWELISVDGPLERGGNANIYVDVLDEHGNRLSGIPVRFFWNGGQFNSNTEPKPGEPDQGTNMPMSAGGNAYGVHVGGLSDVAWGMGMVNNLPHKSWRVVFRRKVAGTGTPPIDPPSDAVTLALDAIIEAQKQLGIAKRMLEAELARR